MKNDGVDSSICDDIRNDWLARELREENYHGCMDHDGAHAEGRANDRGWAARSAMREGYRECAPHEKQHFAQRDPKQPQLQPQWKPQETQAQKDKEHQRRFVAIGLFFAAYVVLEGLRSLFR